MEWALELAVAVLHHLPIPVELALGVEWVKALEPVPVEEVVPEEVGLVLVAVITDAWCLLEQAVEKVADAGMDEAQEQ